MKKILISAVMLMLVSCKKESQEPVGTNQTTTPTANEGMAAETKTPEVLGKEIFEGKGNCIACHQVDQKVIGPSLQNIAQVYKAQNGNIVAFLKEEAKPLVDPTQYEVMKANFAVTKTFSDDELTAVEAYIYSNLK
ncbi:c-type cytochrome [Flavobacterium restrictum]|uniref:C-type cytochrome n=1 Tax=Flavobacterium restrictum TaxID=2594428 RepID=A0A553DT66_9FLAO|nr:c-type cytochrome [Flavobacterium restrictum]TRX35977.1 c-type cytochrome [Flavobacterium restrictum]